MSAYQLGAHTHANLSQGGVIPTIASIADIIHSHQNDGEGSIVDHALALNNVLSAQHHALPDLSTIINPHACKAYKNGAQVINNNVWTKILYDAEVFDVSGDFDADGADSNFIVPSDGYYLILARANFMNITLGFEVGLEIRVNGVARARDYREFDRLQTETGLECAVIESLVAGQLITGYAFQNTGAAKSLFGTVSQNYICISKIGV